MYKDYVNSESKFHWQSQNKVTPLGTGKKYLLNKNQMVKKIILFVGETKKDGYVNYISSIGEKPISMEWKVQKSIMAKFLEAV